MSSSVVLSRLSRSELYEELYALERATGVIDNLQSQQVELLNEAESSRRHHAFLFYVFMAIGTAVLSFGCAGIAVYKSGSDVSSYVLSMLIVLVISCIMFILAYWQYKKYDVVKKALPSIRKEVNRQHKNELMKKQENQIHLQRIPRAYQHSQTIRYMYDLLVNMPNITLADVAERYDCKFHRDVIDYWRDEQVKQMKEKQDYRTLNVFLEASVHHQYIKLSEKRS